MISKKMGYTSPSYKIYKFGLSTAWWRYTTFVVLTFPGRKVKIRLKRIWICFSAARAIATVETS